MFLTIKRRVGFLREFTHRALCFGGNQWDGFGYRVSSVC